MPRFTIDVQMRFRDIDGMGHVNNAVYLSYMELARTHFYLRYANKRSLEEIDFILAHVEIDFEAPAEWGDEVQVSVWPSRIGTTSFSLSYEMKDKKSGRVLARSKSVLVSYDYEKREKKPIPTDFRKVLEANLETSSEPGMGQSQR